MFSSRSETTATLPGADAKIGKNVPAKLLCTALLATALSASGLAREPWKSVVTCDSRGPDDGIEKTVLLDQDAGISDTSDAAYTTFECHKQMPADLNGDCHVDFLGFAILLDDWLSCGDPLDASCD
jgi:hypothetical protein